MVVVDHGAIDNYYDISASSVLPYLPSLPKWLSLDILFLSISKLFTIYSISYINFVTLAQKIELSRDIKK